MPRLLQPRLFSVTVLLWGTIGLTAVSQGQNGTKEKFAQAQKRNAATLRQFTWTTKTALKLKGETQSVKVESVRYDANGQLQKTAIESTPQKQPPSGGRMKEKAVDKKKEEFKELLTGLGRLANSYAHLTPAQMQTLAQGAISNGPDEGTLEVKANDVVENRDHVALWIDKSTLLIQRAVIDSIYEKNPVHLDVTFQRIPNGPSYAANAYLSYPKKELQVDVTNSNYQLLQTSAQPVSPAKAALAVRPSDQGWPRQSTIDGTTLVTYQPQVDDWKEYKDLSWRMAFSLAPKGEKAVVGAANMEALTDVDDENHLVRIHDIKIMRTNFPSLDEEASARMGELLRTFLPPTVEVSLERIAASTPKKESAPTAQLKNDPPRIIVSYRPAILVEIDGDPVFVPAKESDKEPSLEFALNTSWRLFRDKSDSHYYLLSADQWLTAGDLNGPWTAATKLPQAMNLLVSDTYFQDLKGLIPPPPRKPDTVVPVVFYSTTPAEIILFDGQPVYTAIPGTQLSYVPNTVSYVFRDANTKKIYFLTSGRWFRADTLDGPWTFATPDLPADFARIPASSPAAQVLASVPGTEEAKDAVLMAQVPTTAVVDAKAAAESAQVKYDGDPKFAPIEGTSMQYATNTSQKVVKVGDVYYLCLNGVWFLSASPNGPWQTASSVPQEIYSIPPSSPVYNITYVTQTTTPTGEVEASYTAGYMGAFVVGVTTGAVIACGTGYYYPPYIGYYPGYIGYPVYYGAPYSYGAGAYYNSATGRYGVTQTAYGPYGSATRSASYNPYTGTYARSGSVATPYGRSSAAQAYNPYTGAYGATRQNSNAYSQWGSSVVSRGGQSAYTQHYSTAQGTVGSIQGSKGGSAVAAGGAGGNSGFAGRSATGDMYAGRDGNVYKNTGSGWQKYDNGNWNSVNSQPRAQQSEIQRGSFAGSAQSQNLQSEMQNRQRGAESTQRFQQRSFGGGGARFGGRRR